MASIKITLLLLCLSLGAQAQTFAEWFDQKNTKKQYLLQQLAALQAYGSVLKTGYNVTHNGLGTIGNFNNGEFHLHNNYYTNLKRASPCVKNNSQVNDILQWQQDINKAFSHLQSDDYYNKVKAAVLKDCDQELTELQKIMSNNSLQMNDADRLKRISAIHAEMLSNYRFAMGFCNNAALLHRDQTNQATDLQTLKELYGNL
ncbi:MAG: hypothetical protein M3N14_10630 [Bacteroidota bacterium]|nr:hypothetical protein [Bacteroidota bacterium]